MACAPPRQATPYPDAPAPEGQPSVETSLPLGHVRIDERTVLDVAPIVRGWFPHGVIFTRARSTADAALAWVDDDGGLWMLTAAALDDPSSASGSLLDRARRIEGLDLSGRTLRVLERDAGSGRMWLLVADAGGDAWLEIDGRGRSTPLVEASAGIADVRRLSDGVTHLWTAGPAGSAPARLLARGAAPDDGRVWASLPTGTNFAAQPLVVDPDERIVWAATVDAEGRPGIVQLSRAPTAGGEGMGVVNVPLVPSSPARTRGATSADGTSGAVPQHVVLAAATVDGALVFAAGDDARSWISTWSPGRARLTRVLERPGRVRQLDVLPDGAVIAIVERPGEQVRERIDLARRRVTEAASLPAHALLLGAIANDSVWSYSSPEAPLTVVRTRWSSGDDGAGRTSDGSTSATNTPLLAPGEQTLAAKARCRATWRSGDVGEPSGRVAGHWELEPTVDRAMQRSAIRVERSSGAAPWSADLALACAAGIRVQLVVEAREPATASPSAVTWRHLDDASRDVRLELPFRKASADEDLAAAVAFVEFLVGEGTPVASSPDHEGDEDDANGHADDEARPDAP